MSIYYAVPIRIPRRHHNERNNFLFFSICSVAFAQTAARTGAHKHLLLLFVWRIQTADRASALRTVARPLAAQVAQASDARLFERAACTWKFGICWSFAFQFVASECRRGCRCRAPRPDRRARTSARAPRRSGAQVGPRARHTRRWPVEHSGPDWSSTTVAQSPASRSERSNAALSTCQPFLIFCNALIFLLFKFRIIANWGNPSWKYEKIKELKCRGVVYPPDLSDLSSRCSGRGSHSMQFEYTVHRPHCHCLHWLVSYLTASRVILNDWL